MPWRVCPHVLVVLVLALAENALGQRNATRLHFNSAPLRGVLPAGAWMDYFVVASDEDSNLVFKVNATSEYANALGIYVSDPADGDDPPSVDDRNTGQFLDFDATSMIVIDGIRQYNVVVGQCYVRKNQRYFLSIFGKYAAGGPKPTVPYSVSVERVPAGIPLNSTYTGNVCDNRYMHHYWELDSSFLSGGVQTTITKKEGELDAAYMRYEHCAGLASANLAEVHLEGHGTPSGTVMLPQGPAALEAGRYYVSVRGKQELCGQYQISVNQVTQQQLLSSSASTLRAGGFLASLLPAWLLSRAFR